MKQLSVSLWSHGGGIAAERTHPSCRLSLLNAASVATLLLLGAAPRLSAQNVKNYSFSTPALSTLGYAAETKGYQPTLAQSGWYFNAAADIQDASGGWGAWVPTPRFGTQFLRLGGTYSTAINEAVTSDPGRVQQYITGFSATTTYQLVLDASLLSKTAQQWYSGANGLQASLDGNPITWNGQKTLTPTASTWTTFISDPIKVTAGQHFLGIATTTGGSAQPICLDDISFLYTPAAAPKTASMEKTFATPGYDYDGFTTGYLLGGSWGSQSNPVSGSAGGFWNPSTPAVKIAGHTIIPSISLGETGLQVKASTYGQNTGLYLKSRVSGNSVAVNYPIHVSLNYPDQVLPGRPFTVTTSWSADPSASVQTQMGLATLAAQAQLNVGFKLDASAKCFGDNLFDGNVLDFSLNNTLPLIDTSLFFYAVPPDKTSADVRGIRKSLPSNSDPVLAVHLQAPYVHTVGAPGSVNDYKTKGGTAVSLSYLALNPPDAALANPNASYARAMDDLLSIKGDVTNYFAGGKLSWNRAFGAGAPGFSLKGQTSILDLYSQVDMNMLQEATFLPRPKITLTTSDGQVVTNELGSPLTLTMPTNGNTLSITPSISFDNSFTGSTYMAFTGGVYFQVFQVEGSAKAGVNLGSFNFAPVQRFGVEATTPVPLNSQTFQIPFDSQTGDTFQVASKITLPIATSVSVETVDGQFISYWHKLYRSDGLYYWPSDLHLQQYQANSPYYTLQPTYTLRVQGDEGPLPGAPGGQPGSTRLIWDKGQSTEVEISSSAKDASGTVTSTMITPGVHTLTAISNSFTANQTSSIPVEVRAFQPVLSGLYAPTSNPTPTYVTQLPAASGDTTLLIAAEWNYGAATQAFLDDQVMPVTAVTSPVAPLKADPNGKYFAVTIPAFTLADGGVHTFKLVTQGPGGGNSVYYVSQNSSQVPGTYTITVKNPVPTFDTISPSSVLAGSPVTSVHITGSGFVPSSQVTVRGKLVKVQYESSTSLIAELPADALKTAATPSIVVINPSKDAKGNDIGGGQSNFIFFPVNNPVPAIETLTVPGGTSSYGLVDRNSDGFTLNVNAPAAGPSFPSNATVYLNGLAQSTTISSNGQTASCAISASALTSTGAISVMVVSPAPGGGISNSLTLQVIYPKPAISASSVIYQDTLNITISGAGFYDKSTVSMNGSNLMVTSVTPTQIQASIPAASLPTNLTSAVLQVTNPVTAQFPGTMSGKTSDGGPSDPKTVTVQKSETDFTITTSATSASAGDKVNVTVVLSSPAGYLHPGTFSLTFPAGSVAAPAQTFTIPSTPTFTIQTSFIMPAINNSTKGVTVTGYAYNGTVSKGNTVLVSKK